MLEEREKMTRDILRAMGRLDRSRRRYLNERLRPMGLRIPMMMAVLYLNRNPGISQDVLKDELLIDKASCARLSQELEKYGYIRREHSISDRRQNQLFLTAKGLDEAPVLRKLLDDWRELISENVEQAELEQLLKLLGRLAENVNNK